MSDHSIPKDARGILVEQGPEALRSAVSNTDPVESQEPETCRNDEPQEITPQADPEAWKIPDNVFPIPSGGIGYTAAARVIFQVIGRSKTLYMRNCVVHEIAGGDDGQDVLNPVSPERFCNLIEGFGKRVARREMGTGPMKDKPVWRSSTFPVSSAKIILYNDEAVKYLPAIRQLANCPILTNAGEVIAKGFHEHAGGTYISRGEKPPNVPLESARAALLNLLDDFNFPTDADRSRALASLISPALKMGCHIDDDFPIDVAEADQSQSGKTYRQKIAARLYAETPSAITAPRGGVGSVDEAIATALIKGRPFIALDNFRGRLDSTIMEEAIRGHKRLYCRALRASADVDTRPFIWQLSTNGAELTRDLANRSIITRIRKQPENYRFKTFAEGNLFSHVAANECFYLGAIFAVIEEWMRQGCPKTDESRHDFRGWCRVMDWIVQNIFNLAPLLDGHREEQARTANPALQWLREVCHAAKAARALCRELTASEMASLAEDAGLDFPGNPTSREEPAIRTGKILGRLFKDAKGEVITVDGFTVARREVVQYGNGEEIRKHYAITT